MTDVEDQLDMIRQCMKYWNGNAKNFEVEEEE